MEEGFGEIGGMLIFLALVGVSVPVWEWIERKMIDMVSASKWDRRWVQ